MKNTLRSQLIQLVNHAQTDPTALTTLNQMLSTAKDWRERQQIEQALRHATIYLAPNHTL